jgi:uncharacterized protein YjiS (DUF1127 family)
MALVFATSIETSRSGTGAAWLVRFVLLAVHRARERRRLLELSDDQLRDIGLTPFEARHETSRWPWDGYDRSIW